MFIDISDKLENPQRLAALYRLCLLDTPADPAFDRLTHLASRIVNVPLSLITLVDAHRQYFKSYFGLLEPWASLRETPLSYSFCQHVVASGEPLVISDARQHPWLKDNRGVFDLDIIAYAGVPLVTSDGFVLGSFCVIDSLPREWSENDLLILKDLALSIMTEIEMRVELLEQQRIESALRVSEARLSSMEQLKTDMIRIAAHDLRNPLSGVLGFSELLLQGELSYDQRQYAVTIRQSAQRMREIINGILSLQRIESGAQEIIDLRMLTKKVFSEKQQWINHMQQSAVLMLPSDPVYTLGDAMQLQEAMHNLIHNAIKYTPERGHIIVRLLPDASKAIFEVEDSGCGIPEDQQGRLFEPFFRVKTHESSQIEGTGLGLHLVKNIIVRHGGQMRFHSTYTQGSLFGFELPLHL